MTKLKTTIISALVIILLIGGFWFGVNNKMSTGSTAENPSVEETASNDGSSEQTSQSNTIVNGTKTYLDSTAGFSFKYPEAYSVAEIPPMGEGEGRSLLLSRSGEVASIQIDITPFDEDIVLTAERIKADVPDLVMKNPQAVAIGAFAKGVKFDSDTSVNVWFVTRGNLFQMTVLTPEVTALANIVSSFGFGN